MRRTNEGDLTLTAGQISRGVSGAAKKFGRRLSPQLATASDSRFHVLGVREI
jgi:hypothetical protein